MPDLICVQTSIVPHGIGRYVTATGAYKIIKNKLSIHSKLNNYCVEVDN